MPGRAIWHATADTIVATIAGALVLLVFYPITLCATGAKSLVRILRPHAGQRGEDRAVSQ